MAAHAIRVVVVIYAYFRHVPFLLDAMRDTSSWTNSVGGIETLPTAGNDRFKISRKGRQLN